MSVDHYLPHKLSHLSPLRFVLELVASLGVVGDVERVVGGRGVGVVAALNDKRVGLAANDVDLGNHEAVDVPRDAPAHVAWKNQLHVSMYMFCYGCSNKCEADKKKRPKYWVLRVFAK
jgi:hypothetical protein